MYLPTKRYAYMNRLLGHGERAIEEILRRGSARAAFGKSLLSLGGNMEKLADCRVRVNGARLLVLNAAAHLDSFHTSQQLSTSHKMHEQAMVALAVAKLETPRSMQACLDFAVQIHGGGGLSFDHPLAVMWTACRVLRLVDGADEVHQRTIAKIEYKGNSIPAIGRAKL
jgi:acyl-CoA dehydrogenase